MFKVLDDEFHFTLDPCAAAWGPALCPSNYTQWDDGLNKEWPGRVYMNPPYGRGGNVGAWITKARESVEAGISELVVGLLPVRTSPRWFQQNCAAAEIRFIDGRLKFNTLGGRLGAAPFDSMVVVWGECARAGTFHLMHRPEEAGG